MKNSFILVFLWAAVSVWAHAEQVCYPDEIRSTAPTERFEVSDAVAIDLQTGLMWRRCVEGRAGAECDQGEVLEMSWPGALQYTEAINAERSHEGYSNWRLPNIKELMSLAELQCVGPALNLEVFPSAPATRVWTGSPYKFYPHYARFVDFDNMSNNYLERFKPFAVILVRDIK